MRPVRAYSKSGSALSGGSLRSSGLSEVSEVEALRDLWDPAPFTAAGAPPILCCTCDWWAACLDESLWDLPALFTAAGAPPILCCTCDWWAACLDERLQDLSEVEALWDLPALFTDAGAPPIFCCTCDWWAACLD